MNQPYRYTMKLAAKPLRESVVDWLKGGGWHRTKMVFSDPLSPGDPGYAEAPFEERLIFQRDVLQIPKLQQPITTEINFERHGWS